ncbi:nucleotide exchange factor GrpE, partial [Patulibacter sp. S7RM1-6]
PTPAAGGTGEPGPGNAPDDGSTPGDVDHDAQPNRLDADDAGIGPDGRPEGSHPGATAPEDGAGAGAGESAAADADADAEVDAEVVEEEPDWKDRYLRSVAELDNVRKRARRDAALGEARGVSRLARELLPALDNLDRALAHVDETSDANGQLVEGLRIVHRELHAALASAGIEAYDPQGQPFDPRFHEALTQQPADEGVLPGTVVTVYQQGYRRGDDVLRAAKVVVAG